MEGRGGRDWDRGLGGGQGDPHGTRLAHAHTRRLRLCLATGSIKPPEFRMRYIHNKTKREEYGQRIRAGLDLLDLEGRCRSAELMRDQLRIARKAVGLSNNRLPDLNGLVSSLKQLR